MLEQVRRYPELPDEKLIKDLGDSLLRLRRENLGREMNQLHFLIVESQESGEAREELRGYYDLFDSYLNQGRHIQKLLNARTMTGALANQSSNRV
jgi:hypothetical protein